MSRILTSPIELLVLILLGSLDSIPILAISYLASCLVRRPAEAPTWLLLLFSAESIFYLYASAFPIRPAPRADIDNDRRRRLFAEAMHELEVQGKEGLDRWLKGWFYRTDGGVGGSSWLRLVRSKEVSAGKDKEKTEPVLRRGNVEELLAGVFFQLPLQQITSDPLLHHSLTSMLHSLEIKRNHRFPSGYDPLLQPLCPSIRPQLARTQHRPLVLYLALMLLDLVFDWLLWSVGFTVVHSRDEKGVIVAQGWWHPGITNPGAGLLCFLFTRLTRVSPSEKETTRAPIIIIPGLAGAPFLAHLIVPLLILQRPMLVVYQPHFSLRLRFGWMSNGTPPTANMVVGLKALLEKRGHPLDRSTTPSVPETHRERPLILAHSLGSGLAAALNHNSVSGTTNAFNTLLLDPTSIMMCNPHLSQVVYHPALSGDRVAEGAMARLVRYYTRSSCVASYLSRELSPFDTFLSLRQTPGSLPVTAVSQIKVILTREDHLLPITDIIAHCQRNSIECEVLENLGHGGWLSSVPAYLRVFTTIRQMSEGPPLNAVALVDQKMDSDRASTDAHASTRMVVRPSWGPGVAAQAMAMGRSRSRTLCSVAPKEDVPGARGKLERAPSCLSGVRIGRSRANTLVTA
ncbi:hypothetical protein IAU60_000993 [Kwoniella sp. DSM 27419]